MSKYLADDDIFDIQPSKKKYASNEEGYDNEVYEEEYYVEKEAESDGDRSGSDDDKRRARKSREKLRSSRTVRHTDLLDTLPRGRFVARGRDTYSHSQTYLRAMRDESWPSRSPTRGSFRARGSYLPDRSRRRDHDDRERGNDRDRKDDRERIDHDRDRKDDKERKRDHHNKVREKRDTDRVKEKDRDNERVKDTDKSKVKKKDKSNDSKKSFVEEQFKQLFSRIGTTLGLENMDSLTPEQGLSILQANLGPIFGDKLKKDLEEDNRKSGDVVPSPQLQKLKLLEKLETVIQKNLVADGDKRAEVKADEGIFPTTRKRSRSPETVAVVRSDETEKEKVSSRRKSRSRSRSRSRSKSRKNSRSRSRSRSPTSRYRRGGFKSRLSRSRSRSPRGRSRSRSPLHYSRRRDFSPRWRDYSPRRRRTPSRTPPPSPTRTPSTWHANHDYPNYYPQSTDPPKHMVPSAYQYRELDQYSALVPELNNDAYGVMPNYGGGMLNYNAPPQNANYYDGSQLGGYPPPPPPPPPHMVSQFT